MSRKPAKCTCEADDSYERQYLDDGRHFSDCPVLQDRIGTTPAEIRRRHEGTDCHCPYCASEEKAR